MFIPTMAGFEEDAIPRDTVNMLRMVSALRISVLCGLVECDPSFPLCACDACLLARFPHLLTPPSLVPLPLLDSNSSYIPAIP
jgi:hypothetical protein